MDCFFVSVERLKNPALNGLPMVVAGDPKEERSVVASASYEARQFGIYSAMPIRLALHSCADLIVLPPDFDIYQYYHRKIEGILRTFSPLVEMASIDEGYIDLSGTGRLWGPPMEAGERLRWAIKQATQLDCTVGIASTKMTAKIASQKAKPSGMLWVPLGLESMFLAPLSIKLIPGIGKKMTKLLHSFGLTHIHQIASAGELLMTSTLGAMGRWLWHTSIGYDQSPSFTVRQRKSISREITFPSDPTDQTYIIAVLHRLIERVSSQLRVEKKVAKTIAIKLRYEDFTTVNRAFTLPQFGSSDFTFFFHAKRLMLSAMDRRVGIRLIGVKLSSLDNVYQAELFDEEKQLKRYGRLVVIDQIRRRFGFNSLLMGESVYLAGKE